MSLARPLAAAAAARPLSAASASASASDADPVTVELARPFAAHRIEAPSSTVETTRGELVSMFRDMYLMRRLEIASDVLYKSKFIRGFCHLYDGQEAVCVGMEAALDGGDAIITSYRDHCTYVGRGGKTAKVMAELLGRSTGCAQGKGGSMHMYLKEANFYGGNGIVGAQVPLGAGLALAQKYRGQPQVTMALYGDGAANQGQLFEAMNLAALWDLPVIFVCENNHYGMGTAEWRHSKSPDFYTRGDYVPGLKADGMDALAVKQAVAHAKAHCVAGNGPIVIEFDTYRYHGHSMSDPGSTYRTRDEVSGIRQERDPIERVRNLILERGLAETAELKGYEKELRAEVDKAVADAKAAPEPAPGELFSHVYRDTLGSAARNVDATYTALP